MNIFRNAESEVQTRPIAAQYYVLLRGETLGPYSTEELRRVPGFTLQTPIRATPLEDWTAAFSVLDLGAYFGNAKPDVSEETVSRILSEKRKQDRQERWMSVKQIVGKIARRLVFLLICVGLIGVGFYSLRSNNLQIKRWQDLLAQKAHIGIQLTIRALQQFDEKYLPAPGASPDFKQMPRPILPAPPTPMLKPSAAKPAPIKTMAHPAVKTASKKGNRTASR